MSTNVLRIDASARREGSVSRDLASQIIEMLSSAATSPMVCR